jgi:hypothetical protein
VLKRFPKLVVHGPLRRRGGMTVRGFQRVPVSVR